MVTVYKIKNKCTGKCLIGATRKDTNSALKYWLNNCTKKTFAEYDIAKDCKQYGRNTFEIETLSTIENTGEAFEVADTYIIQYNTMEPYGYNRSFIGIRKSNPNFYREDGKIKKIHEEKPQPKPKKRGRPKKNPDPVENTEVVEEKGNDLSNFVDETKEIVKVDFRKKAELLNKYGITGLSKNNIPQILAERESIQALRKLADNLEKYGSQDLYEFVPSELNIETNELKEMLLGLIKNDNIRYSKKTYLAIPQDDIQCLKCGGFKLGVENYFKHPDANATKDGYIHMCKQCIEDYCKSTYASTGNAFYTILVLCQLTNLIFIQEVARIAEKSWQSKKAAPKEIYKYYMSELKYGYLNNANAPVTMLEFRHSNFEGDIFSFCEHHPAIPKVFIKELNKGLEKKRLDMETDETTKLEQKWGIGFTPQEYRYLEQEYNKIEKFIPKKTELHIDALKKYIIYSMKEKNALAKNDLKDVKEWNTLADKAADNAQLKVKQLSENFGAEVDSFAKLVEAVEEYDSVIPVLPKVRKMPYDDIDFLIWESINYIRRLEGKPETTYEEVYAFIDNELTKKMVDLGMTPKQIKKEKEKRNAVFNDLSDNYIEPLWMLSDSTEEEDEEAENEGDAK